jgi:hypothetical protein
LRDVHALITAIYTASILAVPAPTISHFLLQKSHTERHNLLELTLTAFPLFHLCSSTVPLALSADLGALLHAPPTSDVFLVLFSMPGANITPSLHQLNTMTASLSSQSAVGYCCSYVTLLSWVFQMITGFPPQVCRERILFHPHLPVRQ